MHAFARLAVAAVLLGIWAPAAALPAAASVGVGIQDNPVRLSGSAHPGRSYSLPPVYVVNTGSQAETLSVRVERLQAEAKGTNAVPGSWIQTSWSQNSPVAAHQSADIPLELVAPADAKPGSYASDIVVTGSMATSGSGIRFGAAAATGLDFLITPDPSTGLPGWRLWTAIVLITIGTAAFIYKRLGFRVRIERQGGHFGA
jgi:hypothetical protein